MSSRKSIPILSGVLVLFLLLYLFLCWDPTAKQQEQSSYEVLTIFETDLENIVKMRVENETGSYTLVKQEEQWMVEHDASIVLIQPTVRLLSVDFAKMIVNSSVGETGAVQLEDYGLHQPLSRATVTLQDGTEATFLLGAAVSGGNGYYFMQEGKPGIYTVSNVQALALQRSLDDYRKQELYTITVDQIQTVRMIRNGEEIAFHRGGDSPYLGWSMTSPYERGLYSEQVEETFLPMLLTIPVEGVASGMTELENAPLQLQLTGEDFSYDIAFQDAGNGNYYAQPKGESVVYLVKQSNCAFFSMRILDYIDRYPYLPTATDIKTIEVTWNQNSAVVEAKDNQFFWNGEPFESQKFQTLFQTLFTATIAGTVSQQPGGEAVLQYQVEKANGSVDTVSYTPLDERNMAVSVNQKTEFYVPKGDVFAILEGLEQLDSK